MTTQYLASKYPQYLQTQLQRLSSFILYQQKQNQKFHLFESIIEQQNEKIKLLNDKIILTELYQNQNLKNQKRLENEVLKIKDFERKLQRISNVGLDFGIENYGHSITTEEKESIKNEILHVFEQEIKIINQNLLQQVSNIQKSLLKKIRKLTMQEADISIKTPAASKKTTSPLPTNNSQNHNETATRNNPSKHRPQKRISSFIHDQISKFEEQNNNRKINDQVVSFNHKQKLRSPISAYLKRQAQYESNQQNFNTINSQSYLQMEDERKYLVEKLKKRKSDTNKNKKERSKKSRSKSLSRSSISLKKDVIREDNKTHLTKDMGSKNQKNRSISLSNKIKNDSKKRSQQNIKQKKKVDSQTSRLSLNKTNRSSVTKKDHSRSKKCVNHSNQRLSECSNFSRSRSSSLRRQKQYLMNCNKFH